MEGDQNLIPILSIDGGAIIGIIPTIILSFLESELQKLDGPNARIADYFYMISGTNTGGLTTAMLTCPNERGRPLFAAKEIKEFYLKESPRFFSRPRRHICMMRYLKEVVTSFRSPKYDGEYLHNVVKELLGEKRLHDTLTNVAIVNYDTMLDNFVIFSSHELKKVPSKDALLSDICIATMATPDYLPSHYFETIDPSGEITKFNLVDGSIAADNPIFLAIDETAKAVTGRTSNLTEATKHGQFLLLSIGTGTKRLEGFSARETAKWSLSDWIGKRGFSPLADIIARGRNCMIDLTLPMTIKIFHAEDYYLRIQDDTLCGDLSSMDKATPKNLANLVKVGEELLRKSVSKINPETGLLEPCSKESNAEALIKFAKLLSGGRKRRLALNSMGATGCALNSMGATSCRFGKQLYEGRQRQLALNSMGATDCRFTKLLFEGRKALNSMGATACRFAKPVAGSLNCFLGALNSMEATGACQFSEIPMTNFE